MSPHHKATAPRHVEAVDVAVYDGRTLIGSYRANRVGGFDSFDDAGKFLGNIARSSTKESLAARRLITIEALRAWLLAHEVPSALEALFPLSEHTGRRRAAPRGPGLV